MKAIQVDGDQLLWTDVPSPVCGPGHVRIQVTATAINRADLLQRAGGYPPPPGASSILGLECSGEVAEVGDGVTNLSIGDHVCALLSGGGYAEEVVVPAGQVLPIPSGLNLTEAAAIPEVFATAYLNLYMEAALAPGERVVLHAGASGVGTAAIQMLKASGNPSFVTVGSAEKIEQCVQLGADGGFNRHDGDLGESLKAWSADGVDVILDPVGGQYLSANLSALRRNGRLVLIGLMGGAVTEINLGLLLMKRLRVVGSTLRARPIEEKAALMAALHSNIWPALEDGRIKPIIEARFAIADASAAHELMVSNETTGKIILEVR
jgi:putative PIG3 family NAD(P)H quinone oxidoreductase